MTMRGRNRVFNTNRSETVHVYATHARARMDAHAHDKAPLVDGALSHDFVPGKHCIDVFSVSPREGEHLRHDVQSGLLVKVGEAHLLAPNR